MKTLEQQSDEHTFKVGDWVTVNDGRPHQFKRFTKDLPEWNKSLDYENVEMLSGAKFHIPKFDRSIVKFWSPKFNEWCWFWNDGDELPLLGKFSKMDDNLFVSSNAYYLYDIPWCDTPETEAKYDFEYCEPYPHPLPSSLQGLTNAHI